MSGRRGVRECLEQWGFKANPFSESTNPNDIWAGSKDNLEYLKYIIEEVYDEGNVAAFLLLGDYGSGKTYHMRALTDYVNSKEDGLSLDFHFSLKTRAQGFQEILEGFIKAIGSEVLIEVGKEIMVKKKIGEINQRALFIQALEEMNLERDMQFALANLVLDNNFVMTWAWITGRATDALSRKLNMLSNPRDESDALDVISQLIDYLSAKYDIIGVFIDELENLKGKSRTAQSTREGLRDLYDLLIQKESDSGIVIMFAATAIAWAAIAETFRGALRDRIDEEIAIRSLGGEEAEGFVRDLFRLFRKNGTDEISPPFKDEAAFSKYISLSSREGAGLDNREMGKTGSPRRIIKLGKTLFLRACFEGLERISEKDIDRILGSLEAQ